MGFAQINGNEVTQMDYKIVRIHGHYEAYDNKGKFICSGDTPTEVAREIEKQQKGE